MRSSSCRRIGFALAIFGAAFGCNVVAQDASPGPSAPDPINPRQAGTRGQTEVAASYSREWLKYNPDDWTDTRVEALHKFADRKLLIGGATESERFGLRDSTASLAGYYPLGERTTAYAEVAASGTHRVLPRDSAYVQIAQSFGGGWGALGGVKHVEYATAEVLIADLTLENYFSRYRAAFTVFSSDSSTAGGATSYRLQLGNYYGDENNVQLALVRGTEVDRPTGVNQVIATPVKSAAVFGRHWLDRNWSIVWSAARTLQETATRNGASLGLRYRF